MLLTTFRCAASACFCVLLFPTTAAAALSRSSARRWHAPLVPGLSRIEKLGILVMNREQSLGRRAVCCSWFRPAIAAIASIAGIGAAILFGEITVIIHADIVTLMTETVIGQVGTGSLGPCTR